MILFICVHVDIKSRPTTIYCKVTLIYSSYCNKSVYSTASDGCVIYFFTFKYYSNYLVSVPRKDHNTTDMYDCLSIYLLRLRSVVYWC